MNPTKGRIAKSNGTKANPNSYGVMATELFFHLVERVRLDFLEHSKDLSNFQGEIAVGSRVTSNEHILLTLKSNFTEQEFRDNPVESIYDAIQNCAERDWWYAHEKVF